MADAGTTATDLARRTGAEFVGTGLLVAIVIGSGIAAQNMTDDAGLRLLANALATAGGLAVIILVLGPVSGAHLNPIVSLADWWLGRRDGTGMSGRRLATYLPAQCCGAVCGAVLANAMFAEPLVSWSQHQRSGRNLLLSEVVASAGLVVLVVALVRAGTTSVIPWAVGAYIGAAYWWTSSTAFANPAATVGRAFSDTFAGIAPASVTGFVAAQLTGLAVGVVAVAAFFPAGDPADTGPGQLELEPEGSSHVR